MTRKRKAGKHKSRFRNVVRAGMREAVVMAEDAEDRRIWNQE